MAWLLHASRALTWAYRQYRTPPAGVWRLVHALYAFAGELGLADQPVEDAFSEAGPLSARAVYAQTLLLAISNLFVALSPGGVRLRQVSFPFAEPAYAALASRRGLTLPQLALGYVRSRWFVGATLIGATTMAQLEEDIAAAQFSLDDATLAEIAGIQLRYPNPGM